MQLQELYMDSRIVAHVLNTVENMSWPPLQLHYCALQHSHAAAMLSSVVYAK